MTRLMTLVILTIWTATGAGGIPERPAGQDGAKNYFNIPIRVLLERHQTRATVASLGTSLYISYPGTESWQPRGARIEISLQTRGEKKVITIDGTPIRGEQVYVRGGPHPTDRFRYGQVTYRGAVKFRFEANSLLVTNIVPLETYLVGMLAAEMNPNWEPEALKAQAVASRTYALYMKAHPKSPLYDMEDNTQDQVYSGVSAESGRVKLAIESTAGEFLSLNELPIKAYFHSRCGGVTETAKTVWHQPGPLYQARIACPYCRQHPFVWKATIAPDDLAKALKMPTPFVRLIPGKRSPGGRLVSLKVESGGKERVFSSDQFRGLVGYTRLKSTHFDWKVSDHAIEFSGVGAGHGVGMCQWGARELAKEGKTYREILTYYYPGAQLTEAAAHSVM